MPKYLISKFFLLIMVAGIFAPARAQQVVINEVMYHPASTNVLEEWFELFNPAPTAVNLSGWRVTKGVDFAFPTNTILPANGYLVVAADAPTFNAHYPGVANYVAGWTGSLGHSLEISDATNRVVNAID